MKWSVSHYEMVGGSIICREKYEIKIGMKPCRVALQSDPFQSVQRNRKWVAEVSNP